MREKIRQRIFYLGRISKIPNTDVEITRILSSTKIDEEESDLDRLLEESINETQDFDISICNIELINIDKFIVAVMKEKLRVSAFNEEYWCKTYNTRVRDIDSELPIISLISRWPHIFSLKSLVLDFEMREKRSAAAISNFIDKITKVYSLEEIFCGMGILGNNKGEEESPIAIFEEDHRFKIYIEGNMIFSENSKPELIFGLYLIIKQLRIKVNNSKIFKKIYKI
ncbi:MAG: hypothetical protein MHMPM18_002231 [Marteilia pararefringens]